MKTNVWPCLTYADPHAAIRFLVDGLGFEQTALHDSDGTVSHAELRWPTGGGVMLGGHSKWVPAGVGLVYLVHDDPDTLFARAVAAGAVVERGLADLDYGSREFMVRDPEGVYWSVGTYQGE